MKNTALFYFLVVFQMTAHAQEFVTDKNEGHAFPIVTSRGATAIYTSGDDHWLVHKAAELLQQDIEMVTGRRPVILDTFPSAAGNLIIIGSLDRSPLAGRLADEHKIAAGSKGKWEAYSLQVVDHPLKGIGRALVISGSDRRGTAYGVFELSRQIGVSPWYWWADVPVKKKKEIYMRSGNWQYASPAVKYRGFFINDEAPAFSGWTRAKFGGVNHQVYEKVFELLLRLKANYLWPAMWNNAFNDDDTLNPVLADKYGIVMGTSHHEPMLRAQQEWKRYGSGPWNYASNEDTLKAFWKKGIEHMGTHESIVTIGMRGDGDKPMTQGSNVDLLERIVRDQRSIIEEVTGKVPSATPQLWALYKEVQDYYDKGMRVPDDVTLLLCDDNWGNMRKLPRAGAAPRGGGYGIYYHFDYVGGPRNYKWLNTNPISRVWEQMHLALQYGVDRIWIVNVGDIKPMEFPISFFMDYAFDPGKWPAGKLDVYTRKWAAAQFGPRHAAAIADILTKYTRYNARRKPELLSPDTYSLVNYHEAENVVADYNRLAREADAIYREMPAEYRDAYYQLVLYPVKACANLNDMYVTTAMNRRFAAKGNPLANSLADSVRSMYAEDSALAGYYNKTMANGKWDHMMDQTHIGYTYWQEPKMNKMPDIKTIPPSGAPDSSKMNDGYEPSSIGRPRRYFDQLNGFIEDGGYVSMEAEHYSRAVETEKVKWLRIPDLGRTLSGMEAMPVTAPAQKAGDHRPRLEYRIYFYDTGAIHVQAYFSPTLDFSGTGQLRYGVSVDDEAPQVLNLAEGSSDRGVWDKWVSDNIIIKTSEHHIAKPGLHILKYWLVDPGPVLQKIVVDAGGVKPSYLGPPESNVLISRSLIRRSRRQPADRSPGKERVRISVLPGRYRKASRSCGWYSRIHCQTRRSASPGCPLRR
jgi:hypothetical protein